jgi:hypothetical protein
MAKRAAHKPKRKAKKTIKKKPMEDKKESVYGDMTEIFSEPDFSEDPPNAIEQINTALKDAGIIDLTAIPVSEMKLPHIAAAPWVAAIEAYCEEQSITPLDLIEAHKGAEKPKKDKKPIHGLSYFEQRRNRQAFGE